MFEVLARYKKLKTLSKVSLPILCMSSSFSRLSRAAPSGLRRQALLVVCHHPGDVRVVPHPRASKDLSSGDVLDHGVLLGAEVLFVLVVLGDEVIRELPIGDLL